MHLIIIGGFLVNQKPLNALLQRIPDNTFFTFIDINVLQDTSSLSSIVDQIANQIKPILQSKTFNNIAFIGFSMGGLIAIKLAQLFGYSNKPQQIILINSTPKFIASLEWRGIKLDDFNELLNRLEQLSITDFAKYFIRLAAHPHKIVKDEYNKYFDYSNSGVLDNKNDINTQVYKNLLQVLSKSDLREELTSLTTSTSVKMFYSKHDVLVPYNHLQDISLGIQQIMLPNSTHLNINNDIDCILHNCEFYE